MKKAIYTVVLDGYDYFPRPVLNNPSWDKIVFTDINVSPTVRQKWDKVIRIETTSRPDIQSRNVKWLSHKWLPEYKLVCYHDANIDIVKHIPERPFRIKHQARSTIRQEADALNKSLKRFTVDEIERHLKYYFDSGFKDDEGLFLNGLFARYHSKKENELSELVFNHINKFTSRDQLVLPFAMWKLNYKQNNIIDYKFFKTHAKYRLHKKTHKIIGGPIRVHHITPARSDKNYGKAINDIVKVLPDDDWICLRDIDTLPLDHVSFIKQCEDIAKDGRFGLVSCMTNRLGLPWQLIHGKMLSEKETNIDHEIEVAKKAVLKHGSKVEEAPREIAGVMMLFPKKVWTEVGGFREGGIIFGNQLLDNIFYEAVKAKGYKVGIAKGIYLLHLYRWRENTRRYKKHLTK